MKTAETYISGLIAQSLSFSGGRAARVFTLCLCLSFSLCVQASPPPQYTFWVHGLSEGRRAYEIALLRNLIQLTEPEYGPAEINISFEPISPQRGWLRLKRGDGIDIITSPDTFTGATTGLRVEPGIMKNLLGYRKIAIRKEHQNRFASIDSAAQFRELSVGQGVAWQDSVFFKAAGIRVIETPHFSRLFAMLRNQRFDYISLGASEMEATLIAHNAEELHLQSVDDLYVFYPLSVYYMLCECRPELQERLQVGLSLANQNGSFDQIFNDYHQAILEVLNSSEAKVFSLPHPNAEIQSHPELMPRSQVISIPLVSTASTN